MNGGAQNQGAGDDAAGALQNAAKSLPRDTHRRSSGLLIQTFVVGQTHRLELVQRQGE